MNRPLLRYTCMSHGHADWIVLLHGLGGMRDMWRAQVGALARTHNVLNIELHGHSRFAPALRDLPALTLRAVAEDILRVMDACGVREAWVMGASLGTLVTRALAELAPERVRGVIHNGPIVGFAGVLHALFWLAAALRPFVSARVAFHICAWAVMPRKAQKRARKLYCRRIMEMPHDGFFDWMRLLRRGMRAYPPSGWNRMPMPMLFICGRQDHFFFPYVRRNIRPEGDHRLCCVDGCGHLVNIENTDAYNSAMLEFLSQYDCRAADCRDVEQDGHYGLAQLDLSSQN